MNNEKREFRSTDLALSAFLLTKGHKLIGVESDGRRAIFVFSSKGVESDSSLYLNGEAQVEPGAYMLSIRKLKAKLSEVLSY